MTTLRYSILLTTIFFGACNIFSKSPGQVVRAFYTAGNAGEYSEAEKYLSAEAVGYFNGPLGGLIGGLKKGIDTQTHNGTIAKIDILKEDIRGEGATVVYTITYKDKTTANFSDPLLKENGVWKITTQ